MRIGLDLRSLDGDGLVDTAREADRLGIWAVLVDGPAGAALTAAELAVATEHLHVALWIDATSEHAFTLAEEIAVLDQLSRRRALAIVDGSIDTSVHIRQLLHGHVVNGAALAPPPAQTVLPVWHRDNVTIADLTGDLAADRITIDALRDQGKTHIFVRWPGELATLARHLVTRALTPDFPQIVADHADVIAPH